MEIRPSVELLQALKKQKYHIIGRHSAVKRCKWLNEALTKNRSCYKQKFYGIKSHQCIQMTPSLFCCNQECIFCWRAQKRDLSSEQDINGISINDNPEDIFTGLLKAQGAIISGYAGNKNVNWKKLSEASTPKHVAISLAGEPTCYNRLGELIQLLHKKGLTTFLVTNGTLPSKLSKLIEEPTQLYVSLCASNRTLYERVCRPKYSNSWIKLNQTLEILTSFSCPTVIRMTLVDSYNMNNIKEYAKLISKASPTHIETKAYMHIGFSSLRLSYRRMPTHKKVKEFAEELSKETGYRIIDECTDSRVILLSKKQNPRLF